MDAADVSGGGGGHGNVAVIDLAEALSLLARAEERESAEKKWDGAGDGGEEKAAKRLAMFGDLGSSDSSTTTTTATTSSDKKSAGKMDDDDGIVDESNGNTEKKTHPSAWLLEHDLQATGHCAAAALVRWWLLQNRVDDFETWLRATFGIGCAMVEAHGTILRYRRSRAAVGDKNVTRNSPTSTGIPRKSDSGDFSGSGGEKRQIGEKKRSGGLAFMFKAIEDSRIRLQVADYSLSQTTLEQIFIGFAKKQRDDAIARGFAGPEEEGEEGEEEEEEE